MIEQTDDLEHARASRFTRLRRRGTALLCLSTMMFQQACYTSIPVTAPSPVLKGPVTITVNDRGRTLVGPRLGTLLDHVNGRLIRGDAESVEVAVETAEDVRGNVARWGGERFTIPREGIESMTERRVSRSRTAVLLGGIAAAVIVAFVSIVPGKNKSGGDGGKEICCDPI